jgi:hypothetical protein
MWQAYLDKFFSLIRGENDRGRDDQLHKSNWVKIKRGPHPFVQKNGDPFVELNLPYNLSAKITEKCIKMREIT